VRDNSGDCADPARTHTTSPSSCVATWMPAIRSACTLRRHT
jgi:hypothetical protein